MAAEIGAIENQQDCIRLGNASHNAAQYVGRNLLVFRARIETINPRKIDQNNFARTLGLGFADVVFHRHARKIGHLLPQSGQPVKKSRFARVWRPNNGHYVGSGR